MPSTTEIVTKDIEPCVSPVSRTACGGPAVTNSSRATSRPPGRRPRPAGRAGTARSRSGAACRCCRSGWCSCRTGSSGRRRSARSSPGTAGRRRSSCGRTSDAQGRAVSSSSTVSTLAYTQTAHDYRRVRGSSSPSGRCAPSARRPLAAEQVVRVLGEPCGVDGPEERRLDREHVVRCRLAEVVLARPEELALEERRSRSFFSEYSPLIVQEARLLSYEDVAALARRVVLAGVEQSRFLVHTPGGRLGRRLRLEEELVRVFRVQAVQRTCAGL